MIARYRGFGLVEIMVGLAVGMVTILAIFQIYSSFENQKRTTASGSDSQTNGALAQYVLEREIRSAGNGITEGQPQQYPPVTGCLTNVYDNGGNYLVPNFPPDPSLPSTIVTSGTESSLRLAPAVITNGAAGITGGRWRSDSITIMYGTAVVSAPYTFATGTYTPGGATINLTSNSGINAYANSRDMVVAIERDTVLTTFPNPGLNYIVPRRCVLLQAMATATTPTGATVTVTGGRHNRAGGTTSQPAFTGAARLYNLGQFNMVTYRVAANNLVADITKFGMRLDNGLPVTNRTDFSPAATNIVNIQAQYGVDTGNPGTILAQCPSNANAPMSITDADGVVDSWVEPTGRWANDGAALPTLFDLRRIRAVRVGIVARSAIKEVPKPNDPVNYPNYPACSTTTTQPTIHWDSGPDMMPDLAVDPDWRCYRYKVFQTTIPIRNAVWSSTMNPASPASCGMR